MKISRSLYPVLLPITLALLLAGCGQEEPQDEEETVTDRECGPGTMLEDRQCVVAPFECPDGQVVLPTGRCADPNVFCGNGATYDAGLEACVPANEIVCGEGTVELDGRCVVEDQRSCGQGTVLADGECQLRDTVCGDGTSLDEDDLQCLPDSGACRPRAEFDVITGECTDPLLVECGEETIEVNNRCLPLSTIADQLAQDADADANDPDRTLVPGSNVGDQVIFTGTMNPGNLFHTFPVTLEEGQWAQVTLYPRGIPSLGFRLQQSATAFDRRVLPGHQSVPTRTVYAPVSANFNLIIETTLSAATGGPYGDSSWSYVGVIEIVEGPEARSWDLFNEPVNGDLRNTTDNLIEVTVPAFTQAIVTIDQLGPDANNPLVEIWNPDGTYEDRESIAVDSAITLEADDTARTFHLLMDARDFAGPRAHFVANALETTSILPGALVTETITAEQGQLIYLSHATNAAASMTVRVIKDGTLLYENDAVLANNRSSYSASQARRAVFYVPEDGDYVIEYENTASSQITGFFTNLTTRNVPTIDLANDPVDFQLEVTQSMPTGDWRYIVVHSTKVAQFNGEISANSSGNPNLGIYEFDGSSVRTFTGFGTTETLDFTLETPGSYIFAIQPSTALTQGFTFEAAIQPLESFNPGDVLTETFDAATFDILTGRIEYLSGGAPDLTIFNPDNAPLVSIPAVSSGTDVLELLPGTGTYTVEVAHNGTVPTLELESNFQVDTPVQSFDKATPFAETYSTTDLMEEGSRRFHLMRTRNTFNHSITVDVLAADPDDDNAEDEQVQLRLWNLTTTSVLRALTAGPSAETAINLEGGLYLLEVTAITELADGYDLQWGGEESNIFTVSVSSTPGLEITNTLADGTNDVISIPNCPIILAIDMDINITHTWSGDLQIRLTSPQGTDRILRWNSGGSTDDVIGNFNETLPPAGGFGDTQAQPINLFEGESGTGDWQLKIIDTFSSDDGTLNSWTLNLTCDG